MVVERLLRPKPTNLLCNLRQHPFPPWAFSRKRLEMLQTLPSLTLFPPLVLTVMSKAVLLKVWSTSLPIMLLISEERACARI